MEGKPVHAMKRSPIEWNDSGKLRAVAKVPGGAVNPGKVVAGLARAAERAGVQIAENAPVEKLAFEGKIGLHLAPANRKGAKHVIWAERVLLATNAGSLQLSDRLFDGGKPAEPKLTFAIATAPVSKHQMAAMGLGSGRPFYTVDLPYLWGRQLPDGRLVFGSGLLPGFAESIRKAPHHADGAKVSAEKIWKGLEKIDVRKGEARQRLESLERRIRRLHPVLEKIRVTHRWGGPILITKKFLPVFRKHPRSARVIVAGGYSGHGVALSVYLGKWAAEHLLGRRELPAWR